MSKFCRVISGNGKSNSKPQDSLTFSQLESIIDWLIKETLSAEDDFGRKASYVAERDVKTCINNEQLIKLNEEVIQYASNLSAVEEEIKEHEKDLLSIAEIVTKLEERQGKVTDSHFQSDYAAVVSLIDALDAQMMLSYANMTTINEFIDAADIRPMNEATQVITSILNQHLDLLLYIERSLNRLNDSCVSVESQLQMLRQKQTQLFDC